MVPERAPWRRTDAPTSAQMRLTIYHLYLLDGLPKGLERPRLKVLITGGVRATVEVLRPVAALMEEETA